MKCPTCHVEVRETDYFCFNCGKNLKPKPPSTLLAAQLTLYLKSILLPPFGIIWAIPYLKQPNSKSRLIGIFAILLTIVILIVLIVATKNFIDTLNSQIDQQMNSFYL